MITIYLVISLVLSIKYRGITFPESEKGWHEAAKRLIRRPSFSYAWDGTGKLVKVPATEEIACLQEDYREVYNELMKRCRNAKGKHSSDDRLHGDVFTSLVEVMFRYHGVISQILCRECGTFPVYTESGERFIISDDKECIFMMYDAWYQCRKVLRKDKASFAYLVHNEPSFSLNPYGLPKRFTDVERFLLEHGWNPAFVFALNRITTPFIRHLKEPFPLVDRKDSVRDYSIQGFSAPVSDKRE